MKYRITSWVFPLLLVTWVLLGATSDGCGDFYDLYYSYDPNDPLHHRTVLLNGVPIGHVVYPGYWVSGLSPFYGNVELCSWEQGPDGRVGYIDCVVGFWAPAGTGDLARCPKPTRTCRPAGPRQDAYTGEPTGWR